MPNRRSLTLVAALEAQAERAHERPAVSDDHSALTYGELDARATRVAHEVRRRCGPAIEPVGVLLHPSVDAVVALYGVMKAGKIALPLDNTSPRDAVTEVLDHAGAPLTITDLEGRGLLSRGVEALVPSEEIEWSVDDDSPVDRTVGEEDPATLYYTSGSTGRPKGFIVEHGSQMRAVRTWCALYGLQPSDRLALLFHYSFGASRVSLYSALVSGAELRVYDARRAAMTMVARKLDEDRITFAHCSASLMRSLLAQLPEGSNYPALRTLAVGAEGLHQRDVAQFRRHVWRGSMLAYTYATSETGPVSALFVDSGKDLGDGALPVGTLLPGKRARIEAPDEEGIGEILVGGDGLARGYWRDGSQTAKSFVADPGDPNTTVFRTGDRGRLGPDGMLEHHGRIGTLVKVRDYSVDLAEVERALRTVAPIEEAAVVLHQGARSRLVAYVVPAGASVLEPVQLRALLADRLPPYKIPAMFVVLDVLPRTVRGKVDAAALPAVPAGRPAVASPFVAPSDELHQAVAAAWEQVLEVSPIGIHDDFVELGGDSLAAVEIVGMLRDSLDREVPLAVFLEAPTVAQMAELLRRGGEQRLATPLVALREGGSRPPFFCVHGGGGNVLLFRALAERLSPEQPFYGLQLVGRSAQKGLASVERLAAVYVEQIRDAHPEGAFVLGGYSFGGAVAFEMACQLEAMGKPPALVVIMDTEAPAVVRARHARRRLHRRVARRLSDATTWTTWSTGWPRWGVGQSLFTRTGGPEWQWIERLAQRAMSRYHPRAYGGTVLVLRTTRKARPDHLGWAPVVTGRLELGELEGGHLVILKPPHVNTLACQLDAVLAELESGAAASGSPVVTHGAAR